MRRRVVVAIPPGESRLTDARSPLAAPDPSGWGKPHAGVRKACWRDFEPATSTLQSPTVTSDFSEPITRCVAPFVAND